MTVAYGSPLNKNAKLIVSEVVSMVLGYHVIFTAYGFWLTNDPRGSWSDFVRSWELRRFGPATKIDTRQSVANISHDVADRLEAKKALRYPPVSFSGLQARALGNGFALFVQRSGITIWACSIMPEHVHLVIARHTYEVEKIVNHLKGDATRQLLEETLHPMAQWRKAKGGVHTCWTRKEWKVYWDTDTDIHRAIDYVNNNPIKEGKPAQSWKFVTRYSSFSGEPKATGGAGRLRLPAKRATNGI